MNDQDLPVGDTSTVEIRRHWNDHRIAEVRLSDLSGFHWSQTGGGEVFGFARVSPRPMVHAYVECTAYGDQEFRRS